MRDVFLRCLVGMLVEEGGECFAWLNDEGEFGWLVRRMGLVRVGWLVVKGVFGMKGGEFWIVVGGGGFFWVG